MSHERVVLAGRCGSQQTPADRLLAEVREPVVLLLRRCCYSVVVGLWFLWCSGVRLQCYNVFKASWLLRHPRRYVIAITTCGSQVPGRLSLRVRKRGGGERAVG